MAPLPLMPALLASIAVLSYYKLQTVTQPFHEIYSVIAVIVGFIFGSYSLLAIIMMLTCESHPIEETRRLIQKFTCQERKQGIRVDHVIDGYNTLQSDSLTTQSDRNSNYSALVNAYYDLATLFYEWGWGQSFHFANRHRDETFVQSLRRHEYYLCSRLDGIKTASELLDCGCGVGGPMRNIARFTGAHVTGITINRYQVNRGNELNAQAGLRNQCVLVKGDFMKLPFQDNSFDGVYAIEATCHAPDRTKVFAEILRVLKPGQNFVCYEWCLTAKYDRSNALHCRLKKQIEEGDGLPDTAHTWEVDDALRKVGFELLETQDMVLTEQELRGGKTWFHPLTPSWNIFSQRFQFSVVGMPLTTLVLKVLEFMRLAPSGTSKVQTMLQQLRWMDGCLSTTLNSKSLAEGAIGLAKAGKLGIFTPMYLCVARKPVQ